MPVPTRGREHDFLSTTIGQDYRDSPARSIHIHLHLPLARERPSAAMRCRSRVKHRDWSLIQPDIFADDRTTLGLGEQTSAGIMDEVGRGLIHDLGDPLALAIVGVACKRRSTARHGFKPATIIVAEHQVFASNGAASRIEDEGDIRGTGDFGQPGTQRLVVVLIDTTLMAAGQAIADPIVAVTQHAI